MPYSTDPSTYPKEFKRFFELAAERGTFRLPCGAKNTAISLRFRLHAYRRAIEETNEDYSLRSFILRIEGTDIIIGPDPGLAALREGLANTEISENEMNEYLEKAFKEEKSKESKESNEAEEPEKKENNPYKGYF